MRKATILAAMALLFAATSANASGPGYKFKLNGTTIETNSDIMSGPRGCHPDTIDIRTWEPKCLTGQLADPQSIWMSKIWEFCGRDKIGSQCIGAIVAMPGGRYLQVVDKYDQAHEYEVRVTDIYRLGNCLEIVTPIDSRWKRYSVYHSELKLPYGMNRTGRYQNLSCPDGY